MPFLYITEFNQQGTDTLGRPTPAASLPSGGTQRVAIGASSAQSAVFADTTNLVRVHTDQICSVATGTNPTATTSSLRMAADQTEYFSVTPGRALRIAVIANT